MMINQLSIYLLYLIVPFPTSLSWLNANFVPLMTLNLSCLIPAFINYLPSV